MGCIATENSFLHLIIINNVFSIEFFIHFFVNTIEKLVIYLKNVQKQYQCSVIMSISIRKLTFIVFRSYLKEQKEKRKP